MLEIPIKSLPVLCLLCNDGGEAGTVTDGLKKLYMHIPAFNFLLSITVYDVDTLFKSIKVYKSYKQHVL